jgi:hypothetical protein
VGTPGWHPNQPEYDPKRKGTDHRDGKLIHRLRGRVAALTKAIEEACGIIEVGDQRLLASDGPVNGQPPEITLAEWHRMYTVLDKARKGGRADRTDHSTPQGVNMALQKPKNSKYNAVTVKSVMRWLDGMAKKHGLSDVRHAATKWATAQRDKARLAKDRAALERQLAEVNKRLGG